MVKIKFIGKHATPLGEHVICPGEIQMVDEAVLERAMKANPGLFVVVEKTDPQNEQIEATSQTEPGEGEVSAPSPIEPVLEHGDAVPFEKTLIPDSPAPVEEVKRGRGSKQGSR